jgi:hypothetical protein
MLVKANARNHEGEHSTTPTRAFNTVKLSFLHRSRISPHLGKSTYFKRHNLRFQAQNLLTLSKTLPARRKKP